MQGHEERERRDEAPQGATHEELCALVLGELEGEARERVERAVAGSAELAAERLRLERTIGLVRGSLGAPAALSADQRADLARAAVAPARAAWGSAWRPVWRAAAGLLVLAGGLVLAREYAGRRSGQLVTSDQLAQVESSLPAGSGGAELDGELARAAGMAPASTPAGEDKLAALQREHTLHFGQGAGEGSDARSGDDTVFLGLEKGRVADLYGEAAPGAPPLGQEVLLALGERKVGEVPALDSGPPRRELAERGRDLRLDSSLAESPRSGEAPTGPMTPRPGAPGTGGLILKDTSGGRPARSQDQQAEPAPVERLGQPGALNGLGYAGGYADGDSAGELRRQRAVTGRDLSDLDRPNEARGRRELDPAELDELVRQRLERLLVDCRRRPSERPRDMFFRYWGDNPFMLTQLDPLSTFSVDVDTASYALARRYLREGHLPEKAQVRTEEFVNYFAPDVEAPREGVFAIHTDLVPTRFGNPDAERWTLRVVLRGREVPREERRPLDLVFVVDVSGSMREGNRMELVTHGLRLLAAQLDARDSLAIVAFSNEARTVLPLTSAARRAEIETALHSLRPGGGTNTEAGMMLGYDLAARALDPERVTRVVLLSDGVANIGVTDPAILTERARAQRQRGIYMNTIGVGMGNHNDVLLEQLANAGDGICNYVDDEREARRALVDNFTGAFVPIARDVKIQLEFDPARVRRFRQLGYENRALAHQDFRNDAVDAGEVGSGHQVVALYELELSRLDAEAPLGVVRLRWKEPTGGGRDPLEDDAREIERPILAAQATSWEGAPLGYRRAVVVAQFAELLRRSVHAREISFDEVIAEGTRLAAQARDPELAELVGLMERSRQLVLATRATYGEFERCLDLYRLNCILRVELEVLGHDARDARIVELERRNAELERLLADLLRRRLAEDPAYGR